MALSNLASVYLARHEYKEAEPLFRDAIAVYTATLEPNHLNTGIARIKLGRSLLRQNRFAEAEKETRAGYEILTRQTDPSVSWLKSAREDLVKKIYEFRGEVSGVDDAENTSKISEKDLKLRTMNIVMDRLTHFNTFYNFQYVFRWF